ncbi:MAG: hypothetical protein J2P21_18850 [Chloracidobacterium sp.]|nr:hypothetical protein [Chloracidobacterium sp.]
MKNTTEKPEPGQTIDQGAWKIWSRLKRDRLKSQTIELPLDEIEESDSQCRQKWRKL